MKTVIITGASDGLGKALAEKFLTTGYKVVNLSRTPAKISVKPGLLENIKCDLSNCNDIDNAVKIIKEKYSNFSVLINNAAIVGYSKLSEMSYEKLEKTFKINTVAPLYLISKLSDLIVKNEADVINIGTTHSQHAHPGMQNQLAYCASKYGLRGGVL